MNNIQIFFITLISLITLTLAKPALANESQTTQSKNSSEEFDESEFEAFESEYSQNKIYDPYEKVNRKIFAFNDAFDRYFFEHVARIYRKGVPKTARTSIRNFITNLSLPISALNSLLQGKTDNALSTTSNFLINSTIGVFGIFNVAGEKGIRYNQEDFGQTLGHYGSGPGAYLVIPILGPSSTRDFSGWTFDKAINPAGFNLFEIGEKEKFMGADYRFGLTIVSGIDTRESLLEIIEDVRKDSFDTYATIRSAYLQQRENQIKK